MWVGDKVVVGLFGGCDRVRGRQRGDAKACFSAWYTVYVHYFKDIRQGALQSYCVWSVTSSVGMRGCGWVVRLSWSKLGVWRERNRAFGKANITIALQTSANVTRLTVCVWHKCIVTKWLNVRSRNFHRKVNVSTCSMVSFMTKLEGSPWFRGSNKGNVVINLLCRAISWKWHEIDNHTLWFPFVQNSMTLDGQKHMQSLVTKEYFGSR